MSHGFGGKITRCYLIECWRCSKRLYSYTTNARQCETDLNINGWRKQHYKGWTCSGCVADLAEVLKRAKS